MLEDDLRNLLEEVRSGARSADEALSSLRRLPFADLGFARVDHHRALRQGLVEAVYGPGKTPEQVAAIVDELISGNSGPVVLTRATAEQTATALQRCPGGEVFGDEDKDSARRTVVWAPSKARDCTVLVITAGTADLPVATECIATLGAYGIVARLITDCGVAGLHRISAHIDDLLDADAVIVVAGMEGALASVIGGIAASPVVAVPTSTGYGAGLEGVTALLAMHASCAAGVTVVGIDNGFGAACAVARILR
jgi:pyridinium-3,5-biscarboxylic acid mononucleotide synthase